MVVDGGRVVTSSQSDRLRSGLLATTVLLGALLGCPLAASPTESESISKANETPAADPPAASPFSPETAKLNTEDAPTTTPGYTETEFRYTFVYVGKAFDNQHRLVDLGKEVIEPNHLVNSTLKQMQVSRRASVEVELDLQAGLKIHGDRTMLERVLENLVSNAIEAMPDGSGTVMLEGKMQDDATFKQCQVMVNLARLIAERDEEYRDKYGF